MAATQRLRRDVPYVPWFVSRDVYLRMYELLPKIYFKRFSKYFKRWGCLRCCRKRALYGANGLCLYCLGLISDRLKTVDRLLELEQRRKKHNGKSERFLHRVLTAQHLLGDLADPKRKTKASERLVHRYHH
jgi:hypothetical protein